MVSDQPQRPGRWIGAMLLSAIAAGLGAAAEAAQKPAKFWVFVGTYTDGKGKGIYRMTLDPHTGKLSEPVVVAELDNPSFLAVHPSRKFLYAVNETSRPGDMGGVTAFALTPRPGPSRSSTASHRAATVPAIWWSTRRARTSWSPTTAAGAWPSCPSVPTAGSPRPPP
jgi:hypothetical protein